MTPTSVLVSWAAWGGTQPIFYITNHRVTGNTAWIPNPLGLTQNTSQPIIGLTGSTGYDVRLQGSNAAGVAFSAVFTFTTAFGGVVVRDVDVTAEWRGPFVVSRDVVVPAEFRLSTSTVAANVSVNAEWTGNTGTTRDFVVPLEFRLGTTFSRDFAVPLEWGGQPGVSRDFAVPVDIGSTPLAPPLQVQNLALSNPTTTSLLATWDDLITGPPVQGYTLEWKRSTDPVSSFLVVVPSIPEPIAPFAVSRTFAVPAEYGGHVTFSRDVDVPVEWGGAKGASRDFVVPVEFGGSTVRIVDASVPVDFIGTTKNVSRDFIVPNERKTTVRRDTFFGIEFRATPAGPPPAAFYVESDLGDGSTITDPATGITWGLANQSGGIATINSVPNAGSAPTDILVRTFSPDVIWIRDAAHPLLWRSWDGTSAWIPAGGTSDPRYTNVVPLAVTGLAATMSTTSAMLAWGFGGFTTIVGGGFLIRFKRTVDSFYGSDIVQPCVGPNVGQFVDTAGRVFSVNSAGRVVVNGTPDLSSSSVAQLLYRNSQYWYHNTSGGWFFKVLVTDAWTGAGLTAISVPSTATITMNNGHVLSITSDGRIQDNGVDIPGGSGSAAFTYDPAINRIYGLDAGGTGWYYYAGSGSWISTADPTGAVSMGAAIANLLSGTSYDFQVQPFNIAGNAPNTSITRTTSGSVSAPLFSDDFTSLALYNSRNVAAGGTWQPASWFGAGIDGEDSKGTWVVNPFNPATPIQNYTIANGILSMRLAVTPPANLAACGNDATVGGQLQTEPTFQGGPFGYWEIRCAVPKQKGSEFVAWAIDNSGQQELNIITSTDQNGFQFAKLNVWTTSPTKVLNNYFFSYNMANPIDSSVFNTLGIDLQPTTTTFYINRVQVMQFPTPPTYSSPMFWILLYTNAQDEGGGLPLQSTLPSFAQIDYVSTWASPPFTAALPGSPAGLVVVSTASSSATLSWSPPASGAALDNGVYRVTTSPLTTTTSVPYCTTSSGTVADAFGNIWTIAASGGGQNNAVMVNGVFANGWNALIVLLVGGVVYHQNNSGSWYGYTPAGSSINGANVAWSGGGSISPLTSVVINGLSASTPYTFSVTVSNSAGISPPATVNATTTASVGGGGTGAWMNHFAFGNSEFFLGFVDEQEYMCDNGTGHISSTGYNPFSVAGSILSITARTVAASGISNPAGQPWNSGCITSCLEINQEPKPGLFATTAGYFEMRCKVPSGGPTNGGPGFWPAFVLYPLQAADGSNPPGEIDIFEILGASTGTVRQSLHSSVSGASHEYDYTGAGDTSLAFHTFGVDVQSNFITFYVDNVQTAQQATPSDFSGNVWYINAPFSVGGPGSWSGAPTPSVNATIGVWQIDYVGVWSNHATAYPGGTLSKPAALFLDDFTALNISFNGSA